jgi:hypothetical protein
MGGGEADASIKRPSWELIDLMLIEALRHLFLRVVRYLIVTIFPNKQNILLKGSADSPECSCRCRQEFAGVMPALVSESFPSLPDNSCPSVLQAIMGNAVPLLINAPAGPDRDSRPEHCFTVRLASLIRISFQADRRTLMAPTSHVWFTGEEKVTSWSRYLVFQEIHFISSLLRHRSNEPCWERNTISRISRVEVEERKRTGTSFEKNDSQKNSEMNFTAKTKTSGGGGRTTMLSLPQS